MRAIWTGSLSFGLVNIPVRLYSATAGTELSFAYLHKQDLSPIKYVKICRREGKEVPFEDIVKGYEYQDGDYVILTDEDFKKVNLKKTKTIDIVEFTDEKEINPELYEKPYYLEPDKGSEKPYALLREALGRSGKVGVSKFVLRNREHLAVIRPHKEAIVLNQLRFKSELRDPSALNLPEGSLADNREIEMALKFIDQLTDHFQPDEFRDTYEDELKDMIQKKVKGKPVKIKGEKVPEPTRVDDLMSTLKASLEREQAKSK